MTDASICLRSDLFWLRGYVEGGILARKVMGSEASGELASLINQDVEYLERLKDKVTAIIKQLGIEIEDEPQTSSSSCL